MLASKNSGSTRPGTTSVTRTPVRHRRKLRASAVRYRRPSPQVFDMATLQNTGSFEVTMRIETMVFIEDDTSVPALDDDRLHGFLIP